MCLFYPLFYFSSSETSIICILFLLCLFSILIIFFLTSFFLISCTVVKNLPANKEDTRDVGSILGSGRSPGVVNGNLLQYSCLEHSIDRGAWWATVNRVTKSCTKRSNWGHVQTIAYFHSLGCFPVF